jgi:cation:H+ antiporter
VGSIPVAPAMLTFDFWVMLGAVLVMVPYMVSGRKIGRTAGGLFVLVYLAFVAAQFVGLSGMPNNV